MRRLRFPPIRILGQEIRQRGCSRRPEGGFPAAGDSLRFLAMTAPSSVTNAFRERFSPALLVGVHPEVGIPPCHVERRVTEHFLDEDRIHANSLGPAGKKVAQVIARG